MIEHCMAALKTSSLEEVYKIYITDCLKVMVQQWGAKVSKRYAEIINPAPVDTRSANEIVDDITSRAGLKVVKKHERIKPDGDAGA